MPKPIYPESFRASNVFSIMDGLVLDFNSTTQNEYDSDVYLYYFYQPSCGFSFHWGGADPSDEDNQRLSDFVTETYKHIDKGFARKAYFNRSEGNNAADNADEVLYGFPWGQIIWGYVKGVMLEPQNQT